MSSTLAQGKDFSFLDDTSVIVIPDTHRFHLPDSLKQKWVNKTPGWDALAEVTYRRTYSRVKEDGTQEGWFDTCVRVTEGTFTWQKHHCLEQGIVWDEERAQRTAKEFFIRLFELKWTPPGRGLWGMGTQALEVKGGSIVNNCAMLSTKNLFTDGLASLAWLMDMSMLGVGVGFDTKGAGKVKIQAPKVVSEAYVVRDSRQGWCDLIKRLLAAYDGIDTLPAKIDYSQIRKGGIPLKTFGGIASGPEPLIELYNDLTVLLNKYVGRYLDSTGIVDVMNLMGRCVVSGGIRRSSEVALGESTDVEFMELKDPLKHKDDLYHHRWVSNNSIFATVGMDYSRAAASTAKNGEPGYMWLENARAFSRMIEKRDNKDFSADGANPCQPASATVLTPNGIRRFGDLGVGDTIWGSDGWVTVVKKRETGVKPVYRYRTSAGSFMGTEQHKVVSGGVKIPVGEASVIDRFRGPVAIQQPCDLLAVMDGLIIGDGTTTADKYVTLCIGAKDNDYFSSEIGSYIGHMFDAQQWVVKTTIKPNELPLTYNRTIPERYFTAAPKIVASFLRGLYSANGSICGQRVTLKATSRKLIDQVQQMLSSLGIRSYVTVNKKHHVKFSNGEYECKESYDLNITQDRVLFAECVGFIQQYKVDKLHNVISEVKPTDRIIDKVSFDIVVVEYMGDEKVWDITVSGETHTYWTGALLVSNCLEQTLESYELCTLVETYPSRHVSLDDWVKTLKYAYLYAKTVTLIPTHDARTNAVMERNRRIGCSISGIVQAFDKFGRRTALDKFSDGYDEIKRLDRIYSSWLQIPRSIKVSSVKPSGTVSILAQVTPGIHYPQSICYIRNVRIQRHSPLIGMLKEAGYNMEQDKYSPDAIVVSFPIRLDNVSRTVFDVSMWEQLENAAQMQAYWSDNQVSVTIGFSPEEAKDIGKALELYETRLKGVSFLPKSDHGYEQAPYIPITPQQYEAMITKLKPLAVNGSTHEVTDQFCDSESCLIATHN